MCGIAAGEMSMSSTSGARTSRARGPLHGDDRPLLGDRGQPDTQVRELGLQVVLHVVQHARRAAGGRGDVEAVGRQAADDAVVHDEAGFAQHQAVAAAAAAQAARSRWCRGGSGTPPRRARPPRSCRASWRRTCRPRCARRGIRGRPRRACPRRPAGSSGRASTCRHPRTPRPARRPNRASASCAPDRTGRRARRRRSAPKVTGV